ncbi:endonuclease [Desulfurispirillum indicum]|nr:endonuclease [Desulfurispirillum indicum]
MKQVYEDNPVTFYCECSITWQGNKGAGTIDLEGCGYKIRRNETRASRVEWEHVLPAHSFGHQRLCWQDGGRSNCVRTDPVFRAMEADMHNLTPAIGEVNGDRSNYRFGVLPTTDYQHGSCDFKVDFQQRVAQPRPEIRGDIARIYFYMHDRYNLRMSDSQEKLLIAWHKQDPVDEWELERDRRIAGHIGHSNPFVTGERTWHRGYRPTGDGLTENATSNQPPIDLTGPVRGNQRSKIFHRPDCPGYDTISEHNRVEFASPKAAEDAGYRIAGNCP